MPRIEATTQCSHRRNRSYNLRQTRRETCLPETLWSILAETYIREMLLSILAGVHLQEAWSTQARMVPRNSTCRPSIMSRLSHMSSQNSRIIILQSLAHRRRCIMKEKTVSGLDCSPPKTPEILGRRSKMDRFLVSRSMRDLLAKGETVLSRIARQV